MPGIVEFDRHAKPGGKTSPLRPRAEELASDVDQLASVLSNRTRAELDDLIARNASAYQRSRDLVRRGRWSVDRPGPGPRIRAVVVGDRTDPADRREAGRDLVGRLLRSGRRREPRRAGRVGGQRQPDERRASTSLHRARGDQPAQVGIPREHVPRAPNAAQCDPRLRTGAARADVRRYQREASGVPRRHLGLRTPTRSPRSTTCWTSPRWSRPCGTRAVAVPAPRRPRARVVGSGAGEQRRRHDRADRGPEADVVEGDARRIQQASSTCCRTP